MRRATSHSTSQDPTWFDFYPRSPCGERPYQRKIDEQCSSISIHALLAESDGISLTLIIGFSEFLSTLSLRRATILCAVNVQIGGFLSTLSLRRATEFRKLLYPGSTNFYPRSPCGERRKHIVGTSQVFQNFYPRSPCGERHQPGKSNKLAGLFLSTLSLRRATLYSSSSSTPAVHFYPRSPCGERLISQTAHQ